MKMNQFYLAFSCKIRDANMPFLKLGLFIFNYNRFEKTKSSARAE